MTNKTVGKLKKKVGKQEYEVVWGNQNVCYVPPTKKERLSVLKTFVMKECNKCWQFEDSRISTLKKQYLHELLESLS